MALEDLNGTKYIDSLNDAWPLGSDSPSAGDDHIRGIKHVLKLSFPTITGALTRSLDSLNATSLPIGTKLAFYQATAPVGWTRVAGILNTYALRIVASATATGGTSAGTDDPVVNDKVASHTHPAGTGLQTGTNSVNHFHDVPAHSSNVDGAHTHQTLFGTVSVSAGTGLTVFRASNVAPTVSVGTQAGATHQHAVPAQNTGNVSATHIHTVSGNTAVNAGAASWAPRYMDFILCERTS
jgi:hypothetical protein